MVHRSQGRVGLVGVLAKVLMGLHGEEDAALGGELPGLPHAGVGLLAGRVAGVHTHEEPEGAEGAGTVGEPRDRLEEAVVVQRRRVSVDRGDPQAVRLNELQHVVSPSLRDA